MEKRITGKTQLMGLIGSPVGHSGSPAMYNYCFEKLGLDYAYLAFDIKEEQAGEMIKAAELMKVKALNVTMPCKQAVVPYVDEMSKAAALIGACNLIVWEEGKKKGYNTDGIGFVNNLRAYQVEVSGKKLLIAGAGGAGIAILVQCALEGAREIAVFNPKDSFFERAVEKAREVQKAVPECEITVYDLDDRKQFHETAAQSDILINATRAGMAPDDHLSIVKDLSVFRKDLVVADVVYNPKETRLMREAREAGCEKVIGGTGMLVRQGEACFKLFTGEEMPVEEVEEKFF